MRPSSHIPRGEPERPNTVVPSVLPRVLVTVDASKRAQVSVDGIERPDGPVDRAQLGSVLASIVERVGSPVRVEVRESDGTSYADILQPPRHRPTRQQRGAPTRVGAPVLRANGFVAGETVLVAVPLASIRADADGSASLPAVPAMPRRAEELLLLGSISRRTVRGRRRNTGVKPAW